MEITVAKQVDVRANIKKYFDMASNGQAIIIPRKENKNVVIVSEAEFHEMERARRNAEYLAMLEESERQFREGKVIKKTMAELDEMAKE